jgi:uncharacterized protein
MIRSFWLPHGLATLMLAVLCAAAAPGVRAEKLIEWTNLLPQAKPLADPFNKLTQDQRFDVETVIWARGLSEQERGLDHNRQPLEDAKKYEKRFVKAGIDVEKLLKDYEVFRLEAARRRKQVNTKLNGANVKLSGYLLPLEFSETGEKDFLLVPYVGACVHVPPPPANQIVLVRLAKKMVVKDLYTPVWIRGQLQTKQSSKALSLVDGQRNVSIGYHIDEAGVELYKAK